MRAASPARAGPDRTIWRIFSFAVSRFESSRSDSRTSVSRSCASSISRIVFLPSSKAAEQEVVQPLHHGELPTRRCRDAELAERVLEDLLEARVGVEEEDRDDVGAEVVEQLAQQGRLARARLADHREEAFALLDAVAQAREVSR